MFKHLHIPISFFIIVVLLVGCKSKSEECIAPAIDKNLVGTWKAVVTEDGDVFRFLKSLISVFERKK